jgi:uncharacterized protein YqgC (DUF456 family)
MDILLWSLTALLMIAGLIGVVVPMLPGTTLIVVGAVVHKLLLPGTISWAAVAWIGALWLVSIAADFLGVLVGARMFGGSKWGMAGAGGGAFVGLFFSLPGLLLGTLLGAAAAEKLFAKKDPRASLKAGVGAATGFLLSLVARVACAVAMVALFCFAVVKA